MREYTVALVGNSNIGKRTIIDSLTGMNQQTSYYADSHIEKTEGKYLHGEIVYHLISLPDVVSFLSPSKEEEITKDYLCYHTPDFLLVVCDASSLKSNLILALQFFEVLGNAIFCIHYDDDAKKRHLCIPCEELSTFLNVPVLITAPYEKQAFLALIDTLDNLINDPSTDPRIIPYPSILEETFEFLIPYVDDYIETPFSSKWIARKLIEHDKPLIESLEEIYNLSLEENEDLQNMLDSIRETLVSSGITRECFQGLVLSSFYKEVDTYYDKVEYLIEYGYDPIHPSYLKRFIIFLVIAVVLAALLLIFLLH